VLQIEKLNVLLKNNLQKRRIKVGKIGIFWQLLFIFGVVVFIHQNTTLLHTIRNLFQVLQFCFCAQQVLSFIFSFYKLTNIFI